LWSVRVESITIVDKETRDLWVLDTAARTLDRIEKVPAGTGPDIVKAKEQYPSIDVNAFRKTAYGRTGPDQDLTFFFAS